MRIVLFVSILLSADQAQGQQANPFLNVKGWRGTFTHRASDQGQNLRDACTITWHITHDVSIGSDLHLAADTLSHPTYRYWFSTNNTQESIQVDESYVQSCPNPGRDPDIFRVLANEDLRYPPRGFDLSIDSAKGTYSVGFPAGSFVNAVTRMDSGDGMVITNAGAFPFDGANGTITQPLPTGTNNTVLSGSATFRLADVPLSTAVPWFFLNGFLKGDIEVTWRLEPTDSEEAELVVKMQDYADWRPEGSVDEETPANAASITATLQRIDGGTPQTRVKKFRVELLSVSHEPGVCLNFPLNATSAAATPAKADLQFLAELNPDWTLTSGAEPGLAMESAEGAYLTSPEMRLSSFDWGAYALLQVTAELTDGRTLIGHLDGDARQKQIRIPKRAEGSLIADGWKKSYGVEALSDADDSEQEPFGDGHSGDGLTLYEEYRGFYEGGPFNHISGQPKTKDLFVRNRVGDSRGFVFAAAISGLEIHHKLTDDEFPTSRVINANHSAGAPHRVDQHGILVVRRALNGPAGSTCGGPSIPKYIEKIIIDPSQKALEASGEVPWTTVSRNGRIILRDRWARLIAHELMHACNVMHHGSGDILHQEWTVEGNPDGTVSWKEDGAIIRVLHEDGTTILPAPLTNSVRSVWLGVEGGPHSGNEDCIMRYDVADTYRSRAQGNVRYWIDGDEIAGTGLCAGKAGTGINDAGRVPQSRYGNAVRGMCENQICVNDATDHAAGGPCQ